METNATCACGHDALTHAAMRFQCLRCDCENFTPVRHTPGPWKIVDHRKDESCLYIESDHDGIATVFTDTLTSEAIIDANARLIASAPALREALDKIGRAACGEDQIDSALDDTALLGWIYKIVMEVSQ